MQKEVERIKPTHLPADADAGAWVLRKRSSLTEDVKKAIERYILANNLQPRDQLPTEAELCTLFGVSRSAVREAMKILEFMGIVSVEPGRGTFVQEFDAGTVFANFPLALTFRNEDIAELVEIRRYLEDYAIERAVEVAKSNPSHVAWQVLGDCVEGMKSKAAAGESMWEEDVQFHRALASLGGNKVLLMVLEAFWELRRLFHTDNRPFALLSRFERHRQLLDALLQGDAGAAKEQNALHYAVSVEEMQGPAGK